MGHEKGRDTATRVKHNFGMARPEGYRKAVRLMDMAERVRPAGDQLRRHRRRLSGHRRARSAAWPRPSPAPPSACLTLGVPMVAMITGEGGSGGAIAIAAANRVLILEHSIYSVISPEGARLDPVARRRAAPRTRPTAMKITAQDLIGMKIVDRIIPEPAGGAHSDPEAAIKAVGDAVEEELKALDALSPDELRKQRAERFYAIGRAGLT